jgi:hypothetical protein
MTKHHELTDITPGNIFLTVENICGFALFLCLQMFVMNPTKLSGVGGAWLCR